MTGYCCLDKYFNTKTTEELLCSSSIPIVDELHIASHQKHQVLSSLKHCVADYHS